jgi:hypothetical protein
MHEALAGGREVGGLESAHLGGVSGNYHA